MYIFYVSLKNIYICIVNLMGWFKIMYVYINLFIIVLIRYKESKISLWDSNFI